MKRKVSKDFMTVYKYFLGGGKIYTAYDRVYYFNDKDKTWHFVEREDAIQIHTKSKEFLLAAIIKGAQSKQHKEEQ